MTTYPQAYHCGKCGGSMFLVGPYTKLPFLGQVIVRCASAIDQDNRGCEHRATAVTVFGAFEKIAQPVNKEAKP